MSKDKLPFNEKFLEKVKAKTVAFKKCKENLCKLESKIQEKSLITMKEKIQKLKEKKDKKQIDVLSYYKSIDKLRSDRLESKQTYNSMKCATQNCSDELRDVMKSFANMLGSYKGLLQKQMNKFKVLIELLIAKKNISVEDCKKFFNIAQKAHILLRDQQKSM